MKKFFLLVCLILVSIQAITQTYNDLKKHSSGDHIFYSESVQVAADSIVSFISQAENYLSNKLSVNPNYTLLILNPSDWETYAHPQAVYGIPHYTDDGKLIVAGEDNPFWKRNIPPLDRIPDPISSSFKQTYQTIDGDVSLQAFFNLLAIHELGHAYQRSAGMIKQSNWLNEFLCNVLLHTFIAEKKPSALAALVQFPKITVQTIPKESLPFTTLQQFDEHYNEIAQKHPMNYGWYQCHFHQNAGVFYDLEGEKGMLKLWNSLLMQKQKLSYFTLKEVLAKESEVLKKMIEQ